jgi:hypothetical protein
MSERGVEDRSGTRQPLGKKKFWILDFGFWMEEEDQARDAAATGKRIGFASLRLSHPTSNIQHPKSNIISSQPCRFLLASSARVAIGSADFDEGLLV